MNIHLISAAEVISFVTSLPYNKLETYGNKMEIKFCCLLQVGVLVGGRLGATTTTLSSQTVRVITILTRCIYSILFLHTQVLIYLVVYRAVRFISHVYCLVFDL